MRGISVLRAWLDGRQPYAQGVELVEEHGASAQLVQLLHQGENPFTRRKLQLEVQRLADTLQVATTAPVTAAVPTNPVPAAQSVPEAPAPPALVQLRANRLAGFKRASYLKSRLELMGSDEERFTAACEIRQLWRANQKSWDDERYFLEFGFFPVEQAPVPGLDLTNSAAVTKRRNTLRTYISQQRGSIDKQAAWKAELLELDRILDHE